VTIFALTALACLPASAEDFEFQDQENNLAALAAITATSEDGGHVARNLQDNNPYSLWQAEGTEAEIELDLGSVETIGKVEIYIPPQFETPRRYQMTVGHSQDGAEYEDVVTDEQIELHVGKQNRHVFDLDGVEARFVRIIIHDYAPGEQAQLSQVRVLK
jgi:hypothetical protein